MPKISRTTNQPAEGQKSHRDYWRPLAGFVVSKKTAKSACKRNKVKRQTREAYRLLSQAIYDGKKNHIRLSAWYALVFVIHPRSLTSSFDEIARSVESCLIRAEKKFSGSNFSAKPSSKQTSKQKSKDDQDVNT